MKNRQPRSTPSPRSKRDLSSGSGGRGLRVSRGQGALAPLPSLDVVLVREVAHTAPGLGGEDAFLVEGALLVLLPLVGLDDVICEGQVEDDPAEEEDGGCGEHGQGEIEDAVALAGQRRQVVVLVVVVVVLAAAALVGAVVKARGPLCGKQERHGADTVQDADESHNADERGELDIGQDRETGTSGGLQGLVLGGRLGIRLHGHGRGQETEGTRLGVSEVTDVVGGLLGEDDEQDTADDEDDYHEDEDRGDGLVLTVIVVNITVLREVGLQRGEEKDGEARVGEGRAEEVHAEEDAKTETQLQESTLDLGRGVVDPRAVDEAVHGGNASWGGHGFNGGK